MDNKDRFCYDDIIHLPHHVSKNRPQMSMANRAAQFSPFAALSGHDEAVKEEARLTFEKPLLDSDEKEIINQQLNIIQAQLENHPNVEITYYEADKNKAGGNIQTVSGVVKKIDAYKKEIVFQEGLRIKINDVIKITV